MQLLGVARGGSSPAAMMIKDHELLPELPPSHPYYEKRLETRHRALHENAKFAEQRYLIEMNAWSKLYQLIKSSVETVSPILARELHMLCAIAPEGDADGAYFDGPRAWAIIVHVLSKNERTQADKNYY